MKVLVVGGSGIVGTLVLPFLVREHRITVFDLVPAGVPDVESVVGSVHDHHALQRAAAGADALVYMAMGSLKWRDWEGSETGIDVNVKGLHYALRAVAEAGGTQAVYCSTMSVYADLHNRYFADEDVTPDETSIYGFSKWIGEEVCRNATRRWGMNANVLRLCMPTGREAWLEQAVVGVPTNATMDEDVASAIAAELRFQGGFQTFMISGDYEQKLMSMARAKRLLGWEPRARPGDAERGNEGGRRCHSR